MRVPPVSFGSLLIFKLDETKPGLPMNEFLRVSFENNPKLKNYRFEPDLRIADRPEDLNYDSTKQNGNQNFAKRLDQRYAEDLKADRNKVILTLARLFVNPGKKAERYFITAATEKDERKILKVFGDSNDYFVAKFPKAAPLPPGTPPMPPDED